MSTTKLNAVLQFSGSEIFSTVEAPSASSEDSRTLKAAGNNVNPTLTATSVPSVTKPLISQAITLGAGITTIDLQAIAALALPAGASRIVDMTSAKLVAWRFKAHAANDADGILVEPGAADPYPLFGPNNGQIVGPGQTILGIFVDVASSLPAVSNTVNSIDVSGAPGDILYIDLYFGA